MIRLFLRLPLVLAIALPMAWAFTLGWARDSDAVLADGLERFRLAFPADARRTDVLDRASRGARGLLARMPDLGEGRSELMKAGVVTSALHLEATLRILPATALLVLAGVCAGLAFRERLRDHEGYASPTAAGLAQVAVGTGVFWLALFSASPIPASHAWLYVFSILTSLGGALYAANLPLRL